MINLRFKLTVVANTNEFAVHRSAHRTVYPNQWCEVITEYPKTVVSRGPSVKYFKQMVGFSAALGGNRDWSCCLCGAVGIRALDQVPKQTLNSFHMSPTTDPMGRIHSLRSLTSSFYCSLRSSQTDTPHCNLAARTQTYVRTPCYRISIKHSLITAHRGVCKYRIIQNSSGEDKSHTLQLPL